MFGIVREATSGPGCCGVRTSVCRPAREIRGLCVCNLHNRFSMDQSKVFFHLKKLKGAGLVLEEKRGNSNFYSLDCEAVQGLLSETTEYFIGRASLAASV